MGIIDKKNENRIFFKKINTSNYETNIIQDNVEETFNNLSLSLKNKRKNYCIAYQATSAPISNNDKLFFGTVVFDPYQLLKNKNTFTSPITGVLNFNLTANPTGFSAGAKNYVKVYINNNIYLVLTFSQVFAGQSALSFNCFVLANQDDLITFRLQTDSVLNADWGTPASFITMRWE